MLTFGESLENHGQQSRRAQAAAPVSARAAGHTSPPIPIRGEPTSAPRWEPVSSRHQVATFPSGGIALPFRSGGQGRLSVTEAYVLRKAGVRDTRPSMSATSFRLPDQLMRQLDDIAARRRVTRTEVVCEAIEQYCSSRRGDDLDPLALVERLVDYPGSGQRDRGRRSEHYLREMFGERRRRTG